MVFIRGDLAYDRLVRPPRPPRDRCRRIDTLYLDRLGFSSPWRFEEDGKTFVAQVERQGCALILSNQWPEKVGKGLMFISLNVEPETHEAEVAALDALRTELEAKGAPVKDGRWGYRLLVIDDPDGNQLFFNYPNETASGKTLTDEA
jgi:uncharacterized glyoxalase superfamily protein PhnB